MQAHPNEKFTSNPSIPVYYGALIWQAVRIGRLRIPPKIQCWVSSSMPPPLPNPTRIITRSLIDTIRKRSVDGRW